MKKQPPNCIPFLCRSIFQAQHTFIKCHLSPAATWCRVCFCLHFIFCHIHFSYLLLCNVFRLEHHSAGLYATRMHIYTHTHTLTSSLYSLESALTRRSTTASAGQISLRKNKLNKFHFYFNSREHKYSAFAIRLAPSAVCCLACVLLHCFSCCCLCVKSRLFPFAF